MALKRYHHLFFDLDHTLWDYERNAGETLVEIYHHFELSRYQPDVKRFCDDFFRINEEMWALFRDNKIKKEELNSSRFSKALPLIASDEQFIEEISDYFLHHCPQKSHLIEGSRELLDYLKSRGYLLYIVTNGYQKMQLQKMESSSIMNYFTKIFTSENVGSKKPHRDYFAYALKSCNARKTESLVIGDNYEADILGAMNFGIDQVFYNPKNDAVEKKPTYDIKRISELMELL